MLFFVARSALLLSFLRSTIAQNPTLDVQVLSGPPSQPSLVEMELREARIAISYIKTTLGVAGTLDVVEPQFDIADQFWKSLLANSSGDPVAVELELEALVSSELFNVTSFLAWYFTYAGHGWPSRLVRGYFSGSLLHVAFVVVNLERKMLN